VEQTSAGGGMRTRVVRVYDSAYNNYKVQKLVGSYKDFYQIPYGATVDGDDVWETEDYFPSLTAAESFAEKLSKSGRGTEVIKEFG
jgi:hypothetical protein